MFYEPEQAYNAHSAATQREKPDHMTHNHNPQPTHWAPDRKKVLLMHAISASQFQDYPDIGLGYLAASLISNGVPQQNIHILCRNMASWTQDAFRRFLAEHAFDVVGVKAFSGLNRETCETLHSVK